MKKILDKYNNIQILQNINLLSILFLSKLFFDFPILYSEIFIVFGTIILIEYLLNKFLKRKKKPSINSAINTGAGILFFLKTSNPLYFIFASIISILSKYTIKYKGKHFLNPSNIGLVLTFLIFPNNVWIIGEQWDRNYLFIAYIVLFGLIILSKLKYLGITIGFLLSTIIGTYFFLNPDINSIIFNITNIGFILFGLYMITDPAIVPKNINKFFYGSLIGLVYIILQYYFSAPYILLVSLTIISLFHPIIYKYKNKALIGLFIILLPFFVYFNIGNNNISKNIENIQKIELKNKKENIINENKINKEINYLDFKFGNNKFKEKNNENNTGNLDFIQKEILLENKDKTLNYYNTNGLNKNSLTTGYFNNDKYLDFFTITSKGLTIGLYNPEKKNFDLFFNQQYKKHLSPNIFYRAVDYNFDGYYDIITNNNKNLQIEIYLNDNGTGKFIKKNLNLSFEVYQGLGFADINYDYIMDFIVPSNCENISLSGNSKCKENYVYLSDGNIKTIKEITNYEKIKYKKINLDVNVFNKKDIDLKGATLTSVYGNLFKNKKQIYIGNDFSTPDLVYNIDLNKNNIFLDKNFKNYIPVTTFQTMSCDTGDINNDGRQDLFCTEMLYQHNIYNQKVNKFSCEKYNKETEKYLNCLVFNSVSESINKNDLKGCLDLKDNINKYIEKNNIKLSKSLNNLLGFEIGLCINQVIMDSAKKTLNKELCKKIDDNLLKNNCFNKIKKINEGNKDITKASNDITLFPKQKSSNILLLNTDNGFIETTNKYNIKRSDWSWNSNIFDINNDNFLDIYIANGSNADVRLTPNHLFINQN